jgi:hypothetical protein
MMEVRQWRLLLIGAGLALVGLGGLGGCSAPIHRGPARDVQAATAPDSNPAAIVAVGTAATVLVEPDLYTRRDAALAVRETATLGMNDEWEPVRVPDGRQSRRIWLSTSPETFMYFDRERSMWRTGR